MNASKRKAAEAALASAEALMASMGAHVAVLKSVLAEADEDPLLELSTLDEDVPEDVPGTKKKRRRKAGSPISASTARGWIKSGRLVAHQAERGRYVFTASALRAAIETAPARRRERATPAADPLDAWEANADKSLRLVGGSR